MDEKDEQLVHLVKEVGTQIVSLQKELERLNEVIEDLTNNEIELRERLEESDQVSRYIQSKLSEHDREIFILQQRGGV